MLCHKKGGHKVAENKQPTGTSVAQIVTTGRAISWPMADVSLRYVARNIHTESKREHGAAELEKLKLDSIVYSDGYKVDNRLSLNGIHHKRINRDKALANGEVHINGLENFRGYAKRWL